MATPAIPVTLNGETRYVALGTTVRQLLAAFGGGPYPAGRYTTDLRLDRAVNNVVGSLADTATISAASAASNPIRFADAPVAAYAGGVDCFDLPLIQGDALTVGGNR